MAEIITEVGMTLVITFILALIMHKFKQPPIVAYLISGLLLGPFFLNILSYQSHYELLAHLGVSTLLFMVGLQLNFTFIKNVGKVAIITGLGQIVFTSLFGIGFVLLFGFSLLESAIIAVALTFSSTIIIVKLLEEKHALETLYGRISLGFLLVQDVVAVLVLLVLTSVTSQGGSIVFSLALMSGVVFAAFAIAQVGLGRLFRFLEPEMQVLAALSWCLGLAGLVSYLGFSIEIGSLIAGVTLASSGSARMISDRLTPLRDFFLVIFFVFLGAEMFPVEQAVGSFAARMSLLGDLISSLALPTIVLSLFVLIGNPFIVLVLLTRMHYSAKTGFLSGLAVSQISEFSVIITLLARNAGLLSREVVSLITFVAMTTIVGSTYIFYRGDQLSQSRFLSLFEPKNPVDQPHGVQGERHKYIIFGASDFGLQVASKAKKKRQKYIIFDSDFHLVERLVSEGFHASVGDAADPLLLSELNVSKETFIFSTVHNRDVNLSLLEYARKHDTVKFVGFATTQEDADMLFDHGAHEVIVSNHLMIRQVDKTLKL